MIGDKLASWILTRFAKSKNPMVRHKLRQQIIEQFGEDPGNLEGVNINIQSKKTK